MNTLLENPPEVEKVTGGNKYCHIVCMCSPTFGLCGAYKPIQCGLRVIELGAIKTCPKCRKPICKDCDAAILDPCMRCGEE